MLTQRAIQIIILLVIEIVGMVAFIQNIQKNLYLMQHFKWSVGCQKIRKYKDMAHFIRISLLKDLGEIKINLNNVIAISLKKEDNLKTVVISFVDNSDIKLIEGKNILDAKKTYDKFPC